MRSPERTRPARTLLGALAAVAALAAVVAGAAGALDANRAYAASGGHSAKTSRKAHRRVRCATAKRRRPHGTARARTYRNGSARCPKARLHARLHRSATPAPATAPPLPTGPA